MQKKTKLLIAVLLAVVVGLGVMFLPFPARVHADMPYAVVTQNAIVYETGVLHLQGWEFHRLFFDDGVSLEFQLSQSSNESPRLDYSEPITEEYKTIHESFPDIRNFSYVAMHNGYGEMGELYTTSDLDSLLICLQDKDYSVASLNPAFDPTVTLSQFLSHWD